MVHESLYYAGPIDLFDGQHVRSLRSIRRSGYGTRTSSPRALVAFLTHPLVLAMIDQRRSRGNAYMLSSTDSPDYTLTIRPCTDETSG